MNESNALLAQQFQQNDPTAFSKLVGRHHALVFHVCLRLLGHRQDAEDVTQETFTRAARYLHRWDSRRPFEPWLVAIAGNRCRTFLANRRVHQTLSPAVEPISQELAARQDADSLNEELDLALSQIPTCHRQAFVLFHRESLSYAEIAEELACPIGTVKTWVHRARAEVIAQLQQRDVVDSRDQGTRRSAITSPTAVAPLSCVGGER